MGLNVKINGGTPAADYVLVDSPEPLPSFNLRFNNRRVLDIRELFQAEWVKVYGRLNKRNTFSFSTVRKTDDEGDEFGGEAAALAWLIDASNAVPDAGVVTLAIDDGEETVTRTFETGGVESIELVKRVGISLWLTYTIVAGKPIAV